MSARKAISDALTAVLPDEWRILLNEADPVIDSVTVMTYTERITFRTKWERLTRWAVIVMVPQQTGGTDALEDALDLLLAALEQTDVLRWEDAEYSVYADKYPAYKVTGEFLTQITEDLQEEEED